MLSLRRKTYIKIYDILFDLIVNIDDKGNQTFFNPDPNAVDFYDKYNEEISTTSTDETEKYNNRKVF